MTERNQSPEVGHIERIDGDERARAGAERWEVELQRDFLEDAQPQEGDERLLARLVENAMDGDSAARPAPHEITSDQEPSRRRAKPGRVAALLAAFLTAGIAGAWGVAELSRPAGPRNVGPPSAPVRIAEPITTAKLENQQAAPREQPELQATEPQKPKSVASKPSAERLFQQAKQAERSGQASLARATFTRLQSLYPSSPESHVSRLAMGGLLLRAGDAQGALRQYSAYLARGGSLEQEALVGKARSLARLGDGRVEAQTWKTLLAKYPGSLHASRARKRLEALGDSP